MALALGTAAVVLVVLLWELARPHAARALARARARCGTARAARAPARSAMTPGANAAPSSARASCCARASTSATGRCTATSASCACGAASASARAGDRAPSYAYLIYPHRPIVAYVPQTGALLNEYCVAFPDHTRPYGSARLPDSDDVLAKWMALTADERRLIGEANMHLPGRQIDPERDAPRPRAPGALGAARRGRRATATDIVRAA